MSRINRFSLRDVPIVTIRRHGSIDTPEKSEKEDSYEELLEKINEALMKDTIKCPKLFEKMVEIIDESMEPADGIYETARQVGARCKESGDYKARKLASAISQTSPLASILLVRELNRPLSESSLSLEAALSSYNNTVFYRKPLLNKPMAYGVNSHGKLGVGKEGDLEELTPILVPEDLKITDVKIGKEKTILRLENGDYYAIGRRSLEAGGSVDWLVPTRINHHDDLVFHDFQGAMKHKMYSVLEKKESNYLIWSDGEWKSSWESSFKSMVFFVCGRRVSVSKLKCSYCKNGKVYAQLNGALYSGELRTGLREKKEEEVVVIFMKEVILPFYVEGFHVSKDGKSMMFWPLPKARKPLCPIIASLDQCIPLPPSYEPFDIQHSRIVRYRWLRSEYSKLLRDHYAEWEEATYSFLDDSHAVQPQFPTGLPKAGINLIRTLQSLRHFIRTRDGTRAPEVFLEVMATGFSTDKLMAAMEASYEEGRKIRVLVAADPRDSSSRTQEINTKARAYLQELTTAISDSFDALANWRVHRRDQQYYHVFSKYVYHMIQELERIDTATYEINPMCHVHVSQQTEADLLQFYVWGREEDPRCRVIRVEAIAVEYCNEEEYVTSQNAFYVYNKLTEFHIRCVDSSLLEHVENGILNLNNACIEDEDKFRHLFPVFFEFPETFEELRAHQRHPNLDLEKICRNLEASEKYTVTTGDDMEIEVPRALFHFFVAEYDEARRRMAELSGTPENRMSVDVSAKVVKHLMEMLLDTASVFQLDLETKLEILYLSEELMIDYLKPFLFKMIVLCVTEADFEVVKELFDRFPAHMIDAVGRYRPDIVLHWQTLPFDTSNLKILSELANEIYRYCCSKDIEAPITLAEDTKVDDEPIDRQWLISQLRIQGVDNNVLPCLHNSIDHWNGSYESRCLKRCHGCRDVKAPDA